MNFPPLDEENPIPPPGNNKDDDEMKLDVSQSSLTKGLDVRPYDQENDFIEIEGTKYSGDFFRNGFGFRTMIGQVLRIEKHENGVVTVTRLMEFEDSGTTPPEFLIIQ